MIADQDLLSIQQARILAENAFEAQKRLATFPQEKLDEIVEHVASAVEEQAQALAVMSQTETDYGNWQDKWIKNQFVCSVVRKHLRGMRCVGVLEQNAAEQTMVVGVPVGVIIALCPVTSPVSTTVYKALLAIKSGNAIIFSPHPRAIKSISAALDIIIRTAQEKGLPEGCISYLPTVAKSGTEQLMQHKAASLLLITGVPGMLPAAKATGKPLIYGGTGNGPAFIEKTADLEQAVKDIVNSKTFDNGIAPSAEHSVVVETCIFEKSKELFQKYGAYFMSEEESVALAALFYHVDGRCKNGSAGTDATTLVRRAGFAVPKGTKILLAERKYVTAKDPYCKGMPAPVMAFYIEDDWQHACEKCIELLLYERNAHTMAIHSKDEEVILQFALKKPVGRLLVNTPSSFGGMGATTNLFPAMTLGSGSAGFGITSDNVSPMNLIYTRKVGYGVRALDGSAQNADCAGNGSFSKAQSLQDITNSVNNMNVGYKLPIGKLSIDMQTVERILKETLQALK